MRRTVLPAMVALIACGSTESPVEPERVDQRFDPIVGGTLDTSTANDSVVMIFRQISQSSYSLCTGALIAPNLVLTARHCVSNTTETVDCQNDVVGERDPSDLYILRGYDPLSTSSPQALAVGAEVYHDGNTSPVRA